MKSICSRQNHLPALILAQCNSSEQCWDARRCKGDILQHGISLKGQPTQQSNKNAPLCPFRKRSGLLQPSAASSCVLLNCCLLQKGHFCISLPTCVANSHHGYQCDLDGAKGSQDRRTDERGSFRMDRQTKKWLFVFQNGWESFLQSLKIKNEEGLFKF